MRFAKLAALVAAVIGGLAAVAAPSQAAPIGAAAVAGVKGEAPVQTVQYYGGGPRIVVRGPVYRSRPVYGRPVYGRPVYGRPVYGRPVYGRPVYRPRVVCTTRVRLVPTAYGYVRRPVRVCRRAD